LEAVPAFFVRVESLEDLKNALAFAKERTLDVFILGGGSNVLVNDAGWNGIVLKIELKGFEEKDDLVIVCAGESWDELVQRTLSKGLWGIENLSGIPGTVGGGVVQNIGAYGAALSQTLTWVEIFDAQAGEIRKLNNEECVFGYRDSVFKHNSQYVVLRAAFRLSSRPQPNLSYRDLAERFKEKTPTLERDTPGGA
jgi:UDP-N-acetylmuramate dehydrogenase